MFDGAGGLRRPMGIEGAQLNEGGIMGGCEIDVQRVGPLPERLPITCEERAGEPGRGHIFLFLEGIERLPKLGQAHEKIGQFRRNRRGACQ